MYIFINKSKNSNFWKPNTNLFFICVPHSCIEYNVFTWPRYILKNDSDYEGK